MKVADARKLLAEIEIINELESLRDLLTEEECVGYLEVILDNGSYPELRSKDERQRLS